MAWGNMMSYFSLPNFRAIFQGRVRQAGMQTHTIKSHGAKIARDHLHDWLILLLLVVIEVILFAMHPFYRFVGKDMMTDLKYPLKGNTVPVWTVPLYAVLLPVAVFLLVYIRRKDVYDLHHSILGLLFSVLITAVITDAIKNALGWPRPDFFWRCFPDGKELFDRWGNVICHGKGSDVKEGHKSFPSGHTSSAFQVVSVFKRRYLKNSLSQPIKISAATFAGSFAGLGFLSLYLSGKIKAFDRKGHVAKLCIVFLPLLAASLVAISRVDDYWHHWQDVFAGGLLGLIVAAFCYAQFFPPPYNDDGWGPYAYFQALEESRANTNAGQSMNALNSQPMNALVVSQQGRQNGDDLAPLEELESGRM